MLRLLTESVRFLVPVHGYPDMDIPRLLSADERGVRRYLLDFGFGLLPIDRSLLGSGR